MYSSILALTCGFSLNSGWEPSPFDSDFGFPFSILCSSLVTRRRWSVWCEGRCLRGRSDRLRSPASATSEIQAPAIGQGVCKSLCLLRRRVHISPVVFRLLRVVWCSFWFFVWVVRMGGVLTYQSDFSFSWFSFGAAGAFVWLLRSSSSRRSRR